jgi:uncharacterized protein (TIGR00299 family) protein
MGHDDHEHDHDHEHRGHEQHGHGHHGHHDHENHGHHHQQGHARERLKKGEGAGRTLFFDAFSGLAGDMILASLFDLGVPTEVVEAAVGTLGLSGYHLHLGHVHRSGIVATTFDVHVEGKQPERNYTSIERLIAESNLAAGPRALAQKIFRRLAQAEADVHKMPIGDVHFHEVGAVDAIVDIVGAAAALDWLGARVVVSPLPMGRGFVHARHGTLPLPAPAVVSCLAGVPTYGVDVDAELVTPTGAAIVASTAERFERWPTMAPLVVGWGGGQRELPDRPNLLRVVLGEAAPTAEAGESHAIVEANVDDMTGELVGHALRALLAAGALDAWAMPVTMKKGRPGLTVAALARHEMGDAIAAVMLRETSSIGVRVVPVRRVERPRYVVEVQTPFGPIPVKVSGGPYGPPVLKPEFDACALAAEKANVSVREVIAAALDAARSV